MKYLSSAVLLFVVGVASAEAQVVTDPITGKTYEAVPAQGISWSDAEMDAASRNYSGRPGHLATPASAGDESFLLTKFGSIANGYWLGGYQPAGSTEPSGGWTWVNGQTWSYTDWGSGQPDNAGGNENCLILSNHVGAWSALHWDDVSSAYASNGFIVEYDPSALTASDSWSLVIPSTAQGRAFTVPGGKTGWGYAIKNNSPTKWLYVHDIKMLGNVSTLVTPDNGVFNYPLIAPGSSIVALISGGHGLGSVSVDASAAPQPVLTGSFVLTGDWWSGDPQKTGTLLCSAGTQSSPYGLVVVTPGIQLTSLKLSSMSVVGGTSFQLTVSIAAPAPAGGAVVALMDNRPFVNCPTSAQIAAGSTSTTLTIPTSGVPASSVCSIGVVSATNSLSATITVTP